MRRLWTAVALLAGCSTPSPEPASLDNEDRALVQERIRAALDAPYALGKYYAEYEVDGRVLMKCKGTSRGFRNGVVLIEEDAGTGGPLRLLRVGDRSWIYKDGWQDAAGAGWAGVGRGFQDPYEVLEALEKGAERFAPHRQGGLACPGDRNILRPLVERAGAHPPAGSPVEGVLKSGFREGPLVTRFSAENGPSVVWIAKMDVLGWGAAPPMTFDDIPAPFTPDMRAAVRKAQQVEGKKP